MNRIPTIPSILVCIFSISLVGLSSVDYAAREDRVKSMSAVELEELRNKLKRYELLSPEDRSKVETLHRQLQSHEQKDELTSVMIAYYKWLLTLKEEERRSIQTASQSERLAVIKQIRREKQYELFMITENTTLSKEDIQQIFDWAREFAFNNGEQAYSRLEALSDNKDVREFLETRERFLRRSNEERRSELKRRIGQSTLLFLNQINSNEVIQLITEDDLAQLVSRFSVEARAVLEAEHIEDQQDMVRGWMINAIKVSRNPNRYNFTQEEMHKFYNEQLTPKEREQLDKLSEDEFTRELRAKMRRHLQSRDRESKRPGD